MTIVSQLLPDLGMSFIIAQHRAPYMPQLLPGILGRITAMSVVDIEQGMQIRPNCIYVVPPHTDVAIEQEVFILRAAPLPSGWPKMITMLLQSLAIALGPRAVAVILSGMDADGAAALKIVKAAGGETFAQSDAHYPSMPKNALETGHIDHLLSARGIADALNRLGRHPVKGRHLTGPVHPEA